MKSQIICVSGKAEHGKTTFALGLKAELEQNGKKVLILNNGDHLKEICQLHFGWNGEKDEKGRGILQFVGTEVCRANNPDIWVNVVKEDIKGLCSIFDYFIIADTRFPNEIGVLKDEFDCVKSVRLNRLNHISKLTPKQLLHLSEISLDNYTFTTVYNLDSGIPGVNRCAGQYAQSIL